MVNETQKTPLQFYKNSGGNEPVRDWLKELDEPDRYAIGQDLMRAQWRWPVGMPLCRPMGHGLWEIRTNLPSNRIARVLVCLQKEYWWTCTASSRKRKRHQTTNLPWR